MGVPHSGIPPATSNFAEYLESTLDEFAVPMTAIVIEITEQVAVRKLSWSGALISKLGLRK